MNYIEKSILLDGLWQKYMKSKSKKDYQIWFNLCNLCYPKKEDLKN